MSLFTDLLNHILGLNAWVLVVPVWLIGAFATPPGGSGSMKRAADVSWYKPSDKLYSSASMASLFGFMLVSLFIPLKPTSPLFIPGCAAVLAGITGHFLAKVALARSPSSQPAATGVYRFSRNPMYASMLLAFLGAAACSQSPWLLALWTLMAIFTHLVILGEEAHCLDLHGDSYRQYMARVSRYGWRAGPK